MLIGELARRTGVGAKTLRFYERRGLLDEPPRTRGGYRDYPPSAVARVGFIRAAQSAGLTLAEIGQIVAIRGRGGAPCSRVIALLDARAAEIEVTIERLQALHGVITDIRQRSGEVDPVTCSAAVVCEVILPDPTG